MIRADWNKRRLQPLEAELYRTLLAETPAPPSPPPSSAIRPPPSSSPASSARSLAFERAWYRANDQLRRARARRPSR